MSKVTFFLLLAVAVYVWYRWRASRARRPHPGPSESSSPMASMRQCRHCGVHFPSEESVSDGDVDFCCEEHRRLGVGR